MNRLTRTLVSSLCFVTSTGCGSGEPEGTPFSIQFSAASDDGQAISGVAFTSGEKKVGMTDDSGGFVLQLRGAEDSTLPIQATCPGGYESPVPGSLRLTQVTSLSGEPEPLSFQAVCTREVRDVVIVVHAENGADLPVTIDGEVSARTDAYGNAHILVPTGREVKSLAVGLDTTERSRIRPQNPRRVFELEDRDAVALFHQPFSEEKVQRRARSVSSAPRHVPYRMK